MGLEDLEGMERIFSGSNQLASVTRYSTAYRRRVIIDQYFQNWDAEKYRNLGQWLYSNYVQALKILKEESYALEEAMLSLGITGTAQLDEWHQEQVAYLHTLGKEEDYDVLSVAYVELLQELSDLEWGCVYLKTHSVTNQIDRRRYENRDEQFLIATPSEPLCKFLVIDWL